MAQLELEVLPSVSPHVALALAHVPGPAHEIAPAPFYRIAFNIGCSYSVDAEGEGLQQRLKFSHHTLMVIPPDTGFIHRAAQAPLPGRSLRPALVASFRISRELVAESARALGLRARDARLAHKVLTTDEVLRLHAQALLCDLRGGQPDGAQATERAAVGLVSRLLAREAQAAPAAAPGALARVEAHIESHLACALTLEALAEVAGLSVFHFCRVFRETVGATPHQYILERRIALAQRLLWAQDGRSVLDVALACGFATPSHFAAQFKRRTGQTPLQWQRSR
jgi:AraC-like DNA-binding protein